MGRAGSGGGGGGHHSSGSHSSSRSSGGHSMSHSRAGSGSSFSSHSRAGGSSFGSGGSHYSGGFGRSYYGRSRTSYNHTTIYTGNGYGGSYGGSTYRQPAMTSGYDNSYRPSGFMRFIKTLIIAMVVIALAYTLISIKPWQPASTVNREKLTGVAAFNADCVTDELSWFDNVNSAGGKLKAFYDKTGVQPYVYLKAYDASLTTDDAKEAYANELFDQLGLNENAFLYVYFAEHDQDNDVGYMCYVNGKMVDSIMDNESIDIFWSYVDKYWYTDMSTDDMFETIYTKTANTIMEKSKTMADVLVTLIVFVGLIAVLIGIYIVMKTKRQHEAEKAAETERILKTPMQDLTKSSENDPLIDKYK